MPREYWKEVHGEAWRRTRESGFLEWKRVSTSVGLPVVSGLIQWLTGVSLPVNLVVNIGSGLTLYLLLTLVERWVRTRHVVVERDAEQLKAIGDRDRRIAELTASPVSPLRAQILQVVLYQASHNLSSSTLEVSVRVEFRNLYGPNNSIHAFQLWSIDNSIAASAVLPHARALVSGQVWKEHFLFHFDNIDLERATIAVKAGSKWKLTYKDVGDRDHESEIFTRSSN